jgi:hypothetical protein
MAIASKVRRQVHARAGGRCEYCRISQEDDPLTFHVDHVVAEKHGGVPSLDNLCLACSHCNLHKGSDFASVDPVTGRSVHLFNPRLSDWGEHFRWNGPVAVGLTPAGRATIRLLHMNASERVELRHSLMLEGRHPPEF